MTKNDFGVWEVVVKATKKGELAIPHNSKIKVSRAPAGGNLGGVIGSGAITDAKGSRRQISMTIPSGERIERLPAWAT